MVGIKISGLTGGASYCQPGGAGHASLSSTPLVPRGASNPSLLPNPSVFCCLRAFTLVSSCPSTVIAAVHDYVVSRERINPLLVPTAPPRGTAGRKIPPMALCAGL